MVLFEQFLFLKHLTRSYIILNYETFKYLCVIITNNIINFSYIIYLNLNNYIYYKTTSGAAKPKGDALTRKDLKKNKHHRIVSAAKSAKGPQMLKRLHNKGYFTQKGKFGAVKRDNKTKKHGKTRKVRKVIIHEKRSVKSGRFTKGGKHH